MQRQGDEFVPIAVESGGRVHEDALDLLSEACGAIGGSPGERQALLTYWRQRISMANARGVATVIKARTPLCTGVHHPVQPHHFSHLPAIPAPLRPRQTPHQSALPAPAVRPCCALLLAAGSVYRVRPLCVRRAVRRRLLTLYWLVWMARVLWLVTRVTSVGARAC